MKRIRRGCRTRDWGFGTRDRQVRTPASLTRHAGRAAAERLPPALCQRPNGDARRGRAGRAARSVDAKVIVDRVKLDGDMRGRLTDSIETAYREAGGTAFAIEDAASAEAQARRRIRCTCSASGSSARTATSRTKRRSRGCSRSTTRSAPARPVTGSATSSSSTSIWSCPDKTKSIQQGAIEPWTKTHYRAQLAELKRAAKPAGVSMDIPWRELNDEEKQFIVEGDGKDYDGIRGFFRWLEQQEIQGARPRLPEPVSRLSDVPRLRRRAPAARSARRQGGRPDHRSGVVRYRPRSASSSCSRCSSPRKKRPSATRC